MDVPRGWFILLLASMFVTITTPSQLSGNKLCADPKCEVTISWARATVRHVSTDPTMLSFSQGQTIEVMAKGAGEKDEFWEGVIGGKRGYFPSIHVKDFEIEVYHPQHSVQITSDIQSSEDADIDPSDRDNIYPTEVSDDESDVTDSDVDLTENPDETDLTESDVKPESTASNDDNPTGSTDDPTVNIKVDPTESSDDTDSEISYETEEDVGIDPTEFDISDPPDVDDQVEIGKETDLTESEPADQVEPTVQKEQDEDPTEFDLADEDDQEEMSKKTDSTESGAAYQVEPTFEKESTEDINIDDEISIYESDPAEQSDEADHINSGKEATDSKATEDRESSGDDDSTEEEDEADNDEDDDDEEDEEEDEDWDDEELDDDEDDDDDDDEDWDDDDDEDWDDDDDEDDDEDWDDEEDDEEDDDDEELDDDEDIDDDQEIDDDEGVDLEEIERNDKSIEKREEVKEAVESNADTLHGDRLTSDKQAGAETDIKDDSAATQHQESREHVENVSVEINDSVEEDGGTDNVPTEDQTAKSEIGDINNSEKSEGADSVAESEEGGGFFGGLLENIGGMLGLAGGNQDQNKDFEVSPRPPYFIDYRGWCLLPNRRNLNLYAYCFRNETTGGFFTFVLDFMQWFSDPPIVLGSQQIELNKLLESKYQTMDTNAETVDDDDEDEVNEDDEEKVDELLEEQTDDNELVRETEKLDVLVDSTNDASMEIDIEETNGDEEIYSEEPAFEKAEVELSSEHKDYDGVAEVIPEKAAKKDIGEISPENENNPQEKFLEEVVQAPENTEEKGIKELVPETENIAQEPETLKSDDEMNKIDDADIKAEPSVVNDEEPVAEPSVGENMPNASVTDAPAEITPDGTTIYADEGVTTMVIDGTTVLEPSETAEMPSSDVAADAGVEATMTMSDDVVQETPLLTENTEVIESSAAEEILMRSTEEMKIEFTTVVDEVQIEIPQSTSLPELHSSADNADLKMNYSDDDKSNQEILDSKADAETDDGYFTSEFVGCKALNLKENMRNPMAPNNTDLTEDVQDKLCQSEAEPLDGLSEETDENNDILYENNNILGGNIDIDTPKGSTERIADPSDAPHKDDDQILPLADFTIGSITRDDYPDFEHASEEMDVDRKTNTEVEAPDAVDHLEQPVVPPSGDGVTPDPLQADSVYDEREYDEMMHMEIDIENTNGDEEEDYEESILETVDVGIPSEQKDFEGVAEVIPAKSVEKYIEEISPKNENNAQEKVPEEIAQAQENTEEKDIEEIVPETENGTQDQEALKSDDEMNDDTVIEEKPSVVSDEEPVAEPSVGENIPNASVTDAPAAHIEITPDGTTIYGEEGVTTMVIDGTTVIISSEIAEMPSSNVAADPGVEATMTISDDILQATPLLTEKTEVIESSAAEEIIIHSTEEMKIEPTIAVDEVPVEIPQSTLLSEFDSSVDNADSKINFLILDGDKTNQEILDSNIDIETESDDGYFTSEFVSCKALNLKENMRNPMAPNNTDLTEDAQDKLCQSEAKSLDGLSEETDENNDILYENNNILGGNIDIDTPKGSTEQIADPSDAPDKDDDQILPLADFTIGSITRDDYPDFEHASEEMDVDRKTNTEVEAPDAVDHLEQPVVPPSGDGVTPEPLQADSVYDEREYDEMMHMEIDIENTNGDEEEDYEESILETVDVGIPSEQKDFEGVAEVIPEKSVEKYIEEISPKNENNAQEKVPEEIAQAQENTEEKDIEEIVPETENGTQDQEALKSDDEMNDNDDTVIEENPSVVSDEEPVAEPSVGENIPNASVTDAPAAHIEITPDGTTIYGEEDVTTMVIDGTTVIISSEIAEMPSSNVAADPGVEATMTISDDILQATPLLTEKTEVIESSAAEEIIIHSTEEMKIELTIAVDEVPVEIPQSTLLSEFDSSVDNADSKMNFLDGDKTNQEILDSNIDIETESDDGYFTSEFVCREVLNLEENMGNCMAPNTAADLTEDAQNKSLTEAEPPDGLSEETDENNNILDENNNILGENIDIDTPKSSTDQIVDPSDAPDKDGDQILPLAGFTIGLVTRNDCPDSEQASEELDVDRKTSAVVKASDEQPVVPPSGEGVSPEPPQTDRVYDEREYDEMMRREIPEYEAPSEMREIYNGEDHTPSLMDLLVKPLINVMPKVVLNPNNETFGLMLTLLFTFFFFMILTRGIKSDHPYFDKWADTLQKLEIKSLQVDLLQEKNKLVLVEKDQLLVEKEQLMVEKGQYLVEKQGDKKQIQNLQLHTGELEKQVGDIGGEYNQLKRENSELVGANEAKDNELEDCHKKLAEYQAFIPEIQHQLNEALDMLNTSAQSLNEYVDLNTKYKTVLEQNQALQEQLNVTQQHRDQAQNTSAQCLNECLELNAKYETMSEQNQALQEQLTVTQQHRDQAQNTSAQSLNECLELKAKYETMSEQNQALQEQLTVTQQHRDQAQNTSAQSLNECLELKAKYETMSEQNQALQEQLTVTQQHRDQLLFEKENLDEQSISYRERTYKLEEEVKKLQEISASRDNDYEVWKNNYIKLYCIKEEVEEDMKLKKEQMIAEREEKKAGERSQLENDEASDENEPEDSAEDEDFDSELEAIKQSEIDRKTEEKLRAMVDVANTNANLKVTTEERDQLNKTVEIEVESRKEFEAQVAVFKVDIGITKEELRKAKETEEEAVTKCRVLSDFLKEKETKMHAELIKQAALATNSEGQLQTIDVKYKQSEDENKLLRDQVEDLKKEISVSEMDFKKQIREHMDKEHKSFLVMKSAERQKKGAENEARVLRQKLTEMAEKNEQIERAKNPVFTKPLPQHSQSSHMNMNNGPRGPPPHFDPQRPLSQPMPGPPGPWMQSHPADQPHMGPDGPHQSPSASSWDQHPNSDLCHAPTDQPNHLGAAARDMPPQIQGDCGYPAPPLPGPPPPEPHHPTYPQLPEEGVVQHAQEYSKVSSSDAVSAPKKKKKVSWAEESELKTFFFFELIENERVNMSRKKGFDENLRNEMVMVEQEALQSAHNLAHEKMEAKISWRKVHSLTDIPRPRTLPGSYSQEKHIQREREQSMPQAFYLNKERIPDTAEEPEPEIYDPSEPRIIPLEDQRKKHSPELVDQLVEQTMAQQGNTTEYQLLSQGLLTTPTNDQPLLGEQPPAYESPMNDSPPRVQRFPEGWNDNMPGEPVGPPVLGPGPPPGWGRPPPPGWGRPPPMGGPPLVRMHGPPPMGAPPHMDEPPQMGGSSCRFEDGSLDMAQQGNTTEYQPLSQGLLPMPTKEQPLLGEQPSVYEPQMNDSPPRVQRFPEEWNENMPGEPVGPPVLGPGPPPGWGRPPSPGWGRPPPMGGPPLVRMHGPPPMGAPPHMDETPPMEGSSCRFEDGSLDMAQQGNTTEYQPLSQGLLPTPTNQQPLLGEQPSAYEPQMNDSPLRVQRFPDTEECNENVPGEPVGPPVLGPGPPPGWGRPPPGWGRPPSMGGPPLVRMPGPPPMGAQSHMDEPPQMGGSSFSFEDGSLDMAQQGNTTEYQPISQGLLPTPTNEQPLLDVQPSAYEPEMNDSPPRVQRFPEECDENMPEGPDEPLLGPGSPPGWGTPPPMRDLDMGRMPDPPPMGSPPDKDEPPQMGGSSCRFGDGSLDMARQVNTTKYQPLLQGLLQTPVDGGSSCSFEDRFEMV